MVQALDNSCYGILKKLTYGIVVLHLISLWVACGSGGLHHDIGFDYEL